MKTLKIAPILLAAGLFLSSQSQAQHQSIGIKAGFQSSTLDGSKLTNTMNGKSLGLQYLFHVSDGFVFGADLIYSQAGGYYSYPVPEYGHQNFEIRLHQLRFVPKAYVFFRDESYKFRPLMGVGLAATYNMKEQNMKETSMNENGPYASNILPFSMDAVMDLGFQYRIQNNTKFTCNLEYSSGLTMMQKSRPSTPETLRNHMLGFNVGIAQMF